MKHGVQGVRRSVPLVFLALCVLGALFVSGCVPTRLSATRPAKAYRPETHPDLGEPEEILWREARRRLLETKIDPDAMPRPDASLWPAARELAALRLALPEDRPPSVVLESALSHGGVPVRPSSARWMAGFENGTRTSASARLADWLRDWHEEGYTHFSFSLAREPSGRFALAAVACRRTVRMDRPLPRRVEPGEAIRFEGWIGDEIGLLRLLVQEPDGRFRDERVPYLAGRFRIAFRLWKKGVYHFEVRLPELRTGIRTVLRFDIAVGIPVPPERLDWPNLLQPTDFTQRMEGSVAWLRRRFQRRPLPRLVKALPALADWVTREAEALPASSTRIERPVRLDAYPQGECFYYSAFTDHLGALIGENERSPGYRRMVTAPDMLGYQAFVRKVGEGYRVGELLCRYPRRQPNPLADLRRVQDQLRYQEYKREKLKDIMGFEIVESDAESLDRWRLRHAEEALEEQGGLTALLLHPVRKDPNGPSRGRDMLLDETFVALWSLAWRLREGLEPSNPGRESVSLLLLRTLLHQGRIADYVRELELMEDRHPELDTFLLARRGLARGWLAAYLGDVEMAVGSLLEAVRGYEELGYEQMLKDIALQVILVYRGQGGADASPADPENY